MDNYRILGIEKGVDLEEVKKAFRRLAKLHHPDVGGDPEAFKRISRAYREIVEELKKGGVRRKEVKRKRWVFSIFDKVFLKRSKKAFLKAKDLYTALRSPVDSKVLSLPVEELAERFLLSSNLYVKMSALKAIYLKDSSLAYKLIVNSHDKTKLLRSLTTKKLELSIW